MSLSEIARKYIGQKEKPGNSGFVDASFEQAMKEIGWRASWPWCAAFVRLCVREAIKGGEQLEDCTTMGAVRTFHAYGEKMRIGKTPLVDSIAVWRHWKSGKPSQDGSGHIAIVASVGVDSFGTIEGNTNGAGSREGDRVAEKTRPLNFEPVKDGLTLIGFCYPSQKPNNP